MLADCGGGRSRVRSSSAAWSCEDPATGSAVAALAGALLRFASPGEGEHDFVIEQGYEMARPSLITLSVTVHDHDLAGAAIGGEAVAVTEGTIDT
jgi:trans-2,3-dihydro-3-hydroxyanthranilate isomerase